MAIGHIKASLKTLQSGVRCGLLFAVCGAVGIPLVSYVYHVGSDQAAVFLAVPLILLYIAWRTLRIFFAPTRSEEQGKRASARAGEKASPPFVVFVLVFTFVLLQIVLCSASWPVYWWLGMKWATLAASSLFKIGVLALALLGSGIAGALLGKYYSGLILKATVAFVSLPYWAIARFNERVLQRHAHGA